MGLKEILPYEAYTLTTSLSPKEVCKRIADNTGPQRTFASFFSRTNEPQKPYEGFVTDNSFTIKRVISYRNSFLPVIKGQVFIIANKTRINVDMRITYWVLLFVFAAMLFFVAGSLAMNFFFSPQVDNFFLRHIYWLIPILFTLTIVVSFKIESRIAKRFLAELLEADKEQRL